MATTKNAKEKISRFIRRELTKEDYTLSSVELWIVSGGARKLQRWRANADKDIEEIAAEIYDEALEDASASSAVVEIYEVRSFSDDDASYQARTGRFRIDTGRSDIEDPDVENIVGMAIEPTHKNAFGQQLRHNEALFRTSMMQTARIIDKLGDMNETLMDKLSMAYNERFETMEVLQKILLNEREAESEERKQKRQEALMSEIGQTIKLLAPGIVGKWVPEAKKLLPGESAPMFQLKELLDSLSPDEAEQVISIIGNDPKRRAVLLDLLGSLAKTEKGAENGQESNENGNGRISN